MDIYKDLYQTIEKNAETGKPIRIEYIMHQYPWFTRAEIEEAVVKSDHELGKILATLDSKSGSRPEMFGF